MKKLLVWVLVGALAVGAAGCADKTEEQKTEKKVEISAEKKEKSTEKKENDRKKEEADKAARETKKEKQETTKQAQEEEKQQAASTAAAKSSGTNTAAGTAETSGGTAAPPDTGGQNPGNGNAPSASLTHYWEPEMAWQDVEVETYEWQTICTCGANMTGYSDKDLALRYADGCTGSYSVQYLPTGGTHIEQQYLPTGHYICSGCGAYK